ncbi:MAG: hypothetical protein Q7R68_10775 [Nitrospirales bacterium]|nr:hypothetical protein [Nitrospirales bacterium]
MICPRAECGGAVGWRVVVTAEGELEECYCSLCSRVFQWRVLEVYGPCRVRFREEVEAELRTRARLP